MCAMGEPSPCLLPQVLFSSHRWQRQVEFCSSLVSRGMRGQSRFCLAHKPNLTAIKPGLVCIPSHVQLCWVQRVHSLFWALLIGEFSKKHEHPPLLSAELQKELEGLGTLQKGAQLFPPDLLRDSFLLALLPPFSAPRLILVHIHNAVAWDYSFPALQYFYSPFCQGITREKLQIGFPDYSLSPCWKVSLIILLKQGGFNREKQMKHSLYSDIKFSLKEKWIFFFLLRK